MISGVGCENYLLAVAAGSSLAEHIMTTDSEIDFWFSIGSTYTYLAVSRLNQVAADTGIRFRWRPFGLRAILQEMDNIPFATKPTKLAYMWRDVERRASLYGLSINVPTPYPLREFDLANRVAIVGQKEGWCAAYVRATYQRWFQNGMEAGSEPNLSESLIEAGQHPARVIALARSDAIGEAYAEATQEARRLKIFGSPSFVTHGELFWGDDRLEDAVAWHTRRSLQPVR
jgi:2-hydroxychromene-2-carboxylate isomerase